jgi:ribosomal protein S14
MLEINRQPLRELAAAIELVGERPLLRALDIHEKTLYRWRTGRCKIPGHQRQVIRMLLGDLPGTDGQWHGWKFLRGELVSPGGDSYRPGDVLAASALTISARPTNSASSPFCASSSIASLAWSR